MAVYRTERVVRMRVRGAALASDGSRQTVDELDGLTIHGIVGRVDGRMK